MKRPWKFKLPEPQAVQPCFDREITEEIIADCEKTLADCDKRIREVQMALFIFRGHKLGLDAGMDPIVSKGKMRR